MICPKCGLEAKLVHNNVAQCNYCDWNFYTNQEYDRPMNTILCFKCNLPFVPLSIVTNGICPICNHNNDLPEREKMTKKDFQAQEYRTEVSASHFAPPMRDECYVPPTPYTKDAEVLAQGGTQFETGAVRSADKAEVMYHLITPIGLRRIAETYKEGFDKYGAFNCERGMPIGDILNHAIAHIYAYLEGKPTNEDDLAHAAWNLLAAMHMEETHPHLDHQLRPNHPLTLYRQGLDISNGKGPTRGLAIINGKETMLELDPTTGTWKEV